MHSKSPAVAALKAAFPHTIPIFAGFLFLGMTYGVYMRTSGFSFWYPMIMSVVIFGGSLEFVATSMLLAPFAPVQVFLTAVMIQARHLFYGISMLDKYKGTGWKKPYLIYAMCDEILQILIRPAHRFHVAIFEPFCKTLFLCSFANCLCIRLGILQNLLCPFTRIIL